MYTIMLLVHIFICIALVMAVLLQSSKGEGLAGAFGGSSLTGTVFGGRGAATFLSKATTVLAITFMSSCILLTFMNPATSTQSVVGGGSSAVEEAAREATQTQPAPPVSQPASSDQTTPSEPPVDPNADLFDAPAGTEGGATPEGSEQPDGGDGQ